MLCLSIIHTRDVAAQEPGTVSGRVIDRNTKLPLHGAHIIVRNTYTGTTTNADGEFEIDPPAFPVTLVIRHVGYESDTIKVDRPHSDLHILMRQGTVVMDEVVITGEDPAIRIMRRVIEQKQEWRQELESWKAEAYTRQLLSNEEEIVSISETYSTSWWHSEQGHREIITDRRQTANMLPEQNFAASSYLPNFYDDMLNISGFDIIGVTHPDALDYYVFHIERQWK